ncbi:19171_t:CDS:2, partial [Rhizophagus irregularis]
MSTGENYIGYEALKELQIFWQEVIKEYKKSQKIIKECEKENTFATDTFLPKKSVKHSEPLQQDASLLSKNTNIKLTNFCYDIFHELENESYANLFSEKNIKNKVIKHPMDLFTINLKLENNQYKNLKEFEKDIRLMF